MSRLYRMWDLKLRICRGKENGRPIDDFFDYTHGRGRDFITEPKTEYKDITNKWIFVSDYLKVKDITGICEVVSEYEIKSHETGEIYQLKEKYQESKVIGNEQEGVKK